MTTATIMGDAPATMIRFFAPGDPKGQPRRKATDFQILNSYRSTQSIYKTAAEFGMCAQSVHERLTKMGACNPSKRLSAEQIQAIRDAYADGKLRGELNLHELARKLGMLHSNVCMAARKLGLTDQKRKASRAESLANSERMKAWHKTNSHPRGMLGKHHTEETKNELSVKNSGRVVSSAITMKALQTRLANHGTLAPPRLGCSWKSGWREIGGRRIFARSRWEANFARFLQMLKVQGKIEEWEHEPETFWFEKIRRGVRSYLPDFRVTKLDGTFEFYEVKGWMDPRSATKLKRMAKYHPTVIVKLIRADWFKINGRALRCIIKGWET